MGTCASSQYTSKCENFSNWKSKVNIIDTEGKLQQVKQATKAGDVLSQNPNCFMCSSESMFVGSLIPHVDPSEKLQIDHIYLLLPLSKSHTPLSLQDLCVLAIKANAALPHSTLESSCVKQKHLLHNSTLPSVSLGFSRYIFYVCLKKVVGVFSQENCVNFHKKISSVTDEGIQGKAEIERVKLQRDGCLEC